MSEETHSFSADLNNLLSLVINTFYSNPDIFLRELISNGSDALDKIRHQSLIESKTKEDIGELHIEIYPNKENKTLTIRDTGIGMTKNDLINNLGIIAKSGTREFMEKMSKSSDLSLIGQYGVGFLSSFLVANNVTVISKHDDDECHMWKSNASGTFSISKVEDSSLKRGTEIILDMKEDKEEYLEEKRIRDLVKRHSEYTGYNISLFVTKTEEKEVTDDDESELSPREKATDKELSPLEKATDKEIPLDNIDDNIRVENSNTDDNIRVDDDPKIEEVNQASLDSSDQKKTKKITETKNVMEVLNTIRPLWTKNPKDVTDEEYQTFYKNISRDWQDSLGVKHFKMEGGIEYRAILYCPRKAPFDLFDQSGKKRNNIKLYVKSVFITDEVEDLIPEWLKFIQGVVDSEDLPLNISRESLQKNSIMHKIKKNIIKKCIELFKEIAEDKERFNDFYVEYSKSIKLGIHEDATHRNTLAEFLRFRTTKSDGELISLKEYVERMKEGQMGIYFITGDDSVVSSPFLEQFRKRDLEVLYLNEPLDEYIVQQLSSFDDKKLICITKGDIKFEDDDMDEVKADYERLCDFTKLHIGDKVERVTVSNKLTETPCIISTAQHGWSSTMEKIMKNQAMRNNEMSKYMVSKKTFEINPDHKIIKHLKDKLNSEDTDESVIKDLIDMLYQTALLQSGFDLESPAKYAKRLHAIIESGLELDQPKMEQVD